MRESFSTLGTILIWAVITVLSIIGIYHSYAKHDDGALIWSPFALYRGVEFFFHSELKEWKAELPNISYFIHTMQFDNPPEYNTQLQSFKNRISDFSDEGNEYLKNYANKLLSYKHGWLDDFEQAVLNLKFGNRFNFDLSLNTIELRNNLAEYEQDKQFSLEDEQLKILNDYLTENLNEITFDELMRIKREMPNRIKSYKNLMNYAYKTIFQ